MASVILGSVRDLWKKVADAATGAGTAKPTNVLQVGGSDGTNLQPLNVDAAGRQNVVNRNSSGTEIFTAANPGAMALYGSKARISSAPVVGVKTVTSTAAELFAGASRKSGRSRLVVRNLDAALRIRIGPSTVTDTTGFGIDPEAVLELDIDPAADVPIYAVSEAGNVQVEVFEA